MIASLSGILVGKSGQTAVIEAGGVGYQVMMPTPDLGSLPAVGRPVRVHTYLQIKDDAVNLFGFENEAKKELFIQLIGVGNVGPKLAITILSHLTADQLFQAIAAEDIALISSAPGVGRKTSQRLVFELKEKLGLPLPAAGTAPAASALSEAREALIGLGYQPAEAAQALAGAEEGQSADWYVKFALKRLARV